ncbi:MAG TPA: EAL domain-containing protein [Abditibacteriaceae bacterium]|jgi:diguanylate cyclase (GGDEF)-like protein/PAS domain S-box-containing protein
MRQEQEDSGGGDVIRVLLIADNEADSVPIRELLENASSGQFDLHYVSTYDEGLASICHGGYDVCLLDLRLGAHSGIDILHKARETGCWVPTILLTASDTHEVGEQVLRAQASDYLVKTGLTGRKLVRAIRYAIKNGQAAQSLKQSLQVLQATLDALTAHIAALDETGTIVAVNQAWRHFAQENGCIGGQCDIGMNYLRVCDMAMAPDAQEAHLMASGIRSVISGEIPKFTLEYSFSGSEGIRWFLVSVTRFMWDGPPHVVVAHEDVTQRHESEAAMRASEARFRAAAEGSLDSFFLLESVRDAAGALHDLRVVYCNAHGAALLNRPLNEIHGHQLRTLIPAHRAQDFIDTCREVIETRVAIEKINPADFSETNADWLHFQVVPLDDGVAITIKDISEEKRSLRALQKREQQLSEAQQIAHIGSWDADSNTGVIKWSDESYRIYGLEPQSEELSVDRVLEIIHPDDRAAVRETTARARQNRDPVILQHRLVRPDGELRIVESRAEVVADAHGAAARVVGTVHDITEQVQAERALHESRERLQAIITTVDMVIWSLDRDGVITMSEGKGLATVGLKPGEVVGRSIFELYADDSPSGQAARRVLSGEDVGVTLENGDVYWEVRYSPLRNREGQIIGAIGLAIDITERLQTEKALLKSNQQILTIWESMADAFYALDSEWQFTHLNTQAERLLQRGRDELLGRVIWDVFPETVASTFFDEYTRAVREQVPVSFEEFYPPLGGWFAVRAYPSEVGLSVYFDNITERRRAEEALRQAEEKYRSIFEHAVEGIFQCTPDARYVHVNPALARIYGYDSPQDLINSVTDIRQQFVDTHHYAELLQTLNDEGMVREVEAQVFRKDGTVIWISINARTIRDNAGQPLFYESSVEDISQRKESEYRLYLEAFYDRLTRLPNRALFINRLGHVLELAKRREEFRFAVLFLDFDGFKHINDSLGHVLGDELLIEVGRRLGVGLRPGDTVARLGGDEFTVLLEDIKDVNSAIQVAQRIHHEMARPLHLDGHEVFPSVSIGIALSTPNYEKAEDVLRDADTAMYRAKARGRGHYQVFDPSMHAHAVHRLNMEGELRRAIENGEIEPFYQPIVALDNGALCGFEALVRWHHPQRGVVAPGEFIPIAEETGLIVPLDERVRWLACRQLQQWQADNAHGRHWTMSVNVSRKTFSVANLDTEIEHVLHMTQLPPQSLKVEITETTIVDNVAVAESTLRKLKERGVSLSMDDFGTGYSSLSYLHRFPLDSLKIDRSFVTRIVQGGESLEIVRAIITLAHTLRMNVVAEGVESAGQATLLRELGCEFGQGYFFSPPVHAASATQMLAPGYHWNW